MPIEFASRSITGSTAVITGAASGMGRATALLFAAEGAHVVLADRSADQLATVVREAEELGATSGSQAVGLECDVREPADLQRLVETAADRFGGKIGRAHV